VLPSHAQGADTLQKSFFPERAASIAVHGRHRSEWAFKKQPSVDVSAMYIETATFAVMMGIVLRERTLPRWLAVSFSDSNTITPFGAFVSARVTSMCKSNSYA
jgi:hypothetical protein